MILEEEIEIPLNGQNISYYENLGYYIPREPSKDKHRHRLCVRKGTRINVKISDLPNGSNEYIPCKCDYCGKEFSRMYYLIVRDHKNGNVKDSCGDNECTKKKNQETKILKYGSISQIDICLENGSCLGRKLKYDLEHYITLFKKHGRTLCVDMIDDISHITTTTSLPFICDIHTDVGVQYGTYDSMMRVSHCCKYGGIEAVVEAHSTVDIQDAQEICNERDYTLLTNKITSVDTKIEYICNKHAEYGIQTTTLYGMTHYDCNCRLCASEKISGENNWNWRGGISGINDAARKSWEYKQWRLSVYTRDNFMCQCCGKTSKDVKLHAHHIVNFANNEDLRYDVDNGITLCEGCHSINLPDSFHSVYGTCGNTREQLDEYIANKQNNLQYKII